MQITSANSTLVGSPVTSANFVAGVDSSDSVTITSAQTGTTLTATDTADNTKTGTSGTFTVNPGVLNHFAFAAIGTQTAGTAFGLTITAEDAWDNTVTGFLGTVQITSANSTLVGSPVTSANFVAGVDSSDSVTITSAQTGTTLTATDTADNTKTGTSGTFTVNPGVLDHFAFAAIGTQTAGTAFGLTITAEDAWDNTVTGFLGTVQITSANSTLVGSPVTSANFVAGVDSSDSVTITSAQTGTTLTATDTADNTKTGTSGTFTVNPGVLNHFAFAAIGTQTAGTAFGLTITAEDAWDNTVTGFLGTVQITSANSTLVGSPVTSADFVAGVDSSDSVTITSAQTGTTLTATDTADNTKTGTSGTFTVNPGVLNHFAFAAIGTQTAGTAFGLTITAEDAWDNTVTGFLGTVQITSANSTLVGSPVTSANFVAGVDSSDSVTITSAQTGTTLTATDTADNTKTGTSGTFTVNPGVLNHFAFAAIGTQTAGTAFGLTITAEDAWDNTVTGFLGTVQITSANSTLVGSPVTSANFVAGVDSSDSVTITSAQTGTTLTATDTADNTKTGTSGTFTVNPGVLNHFAFAAIGTQTAGTAFGLTITAEDAWDNTVTGSPWAPCRSPRPTARWSARR